MCRCCPTYKDVHFFQIQIGMHTWERQRKRLLFYLTESWASLNLLVLSIIDSMDKAAESKEFLLVKRVNLQME